MSLKHSVSHTPKKEQIRKGVKKMNEYERAEMEIVRFDSADVIRTSPTGGSIDEGEDEI